MPAIRDALLQAHQLGQHHRARHHQQGCGAARAAITLGVVALDGRGRDDGLCIGDVGRVVAHEDADAHSSPSRRDVTLSDWSEPEQA